ncbi:phage holin family protein [Candidatus Saccharibacteria bacterium]|nr:MAG: phage holin family protein [Candidatus Saccharibacteria bacterium]
MRKQFALFLLRWVANSFGLWLASRVLSGSFSDTDATAATFLLAGLVLSILNSILRPIIVVLSLPAIVLTLGLFTLVVNGIIVYVALKLVPGLDISFAASILTGLLISLINYAISGILELRNNSTQEKFQP